MPIPKVTHHVIGAITQEDCHSRRRAGPPFWICQSMVGSYIHMTNAVGMWKLALAERILTVVGPNWADILMKAGSCWQDSEVQLLSICSLWRRPSIGLRRSVRPSLHLVQRWVRTVPSETVLIFNWWSWTINSWPYIVYFISLQETISYVA